MAKGRKPRRALGDRQDAVKSIKTRLNTLYFGKSKESIRFQAKLLVFDAALIAFFIVSPFLEHGPLFLVIDYVIAAVLLIDLVARAWAYGNFRKWVSRPIVWADIIVLLSLVIPVYAANLGFLRILRAYSLINGQAFWRIIGHGRWMNSHLAESAKAIANLTVFIFMMTALVHSGFAARVPAVASYMDSLYFTVTTLTTTGYGDIVLPGFGGRLLSILIMIGGVSLFFRLVQVTMRTPKVRHPCPYCGLMRHEADAVHCKACGASIRIEYENE
ncbi:ion channel [Emcibacter sp. SYSU 3D8]|uniref:ion channel n=1 Tax=Emcibacter sp. SYSU 3D8 TaxID=3133969 RepID=UPI0031FEA52F